MKSSSCISVILMAGLVCGLSVKPVRGEGFFAFSQIRGESLPADQIYPKGRIFPFSFFSAALEGFSHGGESGYQAALKAYKADGFTMIGPQYALNHRAPRDAASIGLKAIYAIGSDEQGNNWFSFTSDPPSTFDPEEVAQRVTAAVKAVSDDSTIAWWYLEPEELRSWKPNEMLYLETVSNAIRNADPLKRPIWMYEQNHRDAKGLLPLLKYLDVCGKGAYVNYAHQRESRIWVRWTLEQEVKASREAERRGVIPILVPEMFEQPPAGTEFLVPTWVRHDVYLGLVFGAKGIVVYSMAPRQGFSAHEDYYTAYAKAAREITGEQGFGQVFLFGETRDDLRIEVTGGPRTIMQADTFGAGLGRSLEYPSIAFYNAAYGKDRYLFVVNSANEAVKIRVSGLPPVRVVIQDLFDKSNQTIVESGQFDSSFKPLEVKGWLFAPAGQ